VASTFRVTAYELGEGVFSGASHTLRLERPLAEDYFCVVIGSDAQTIYRGLDDDGVRVSGDPHGNMSVRTAADEIELSRGAGGHDWLGTVQVVECLGSLDEDGFRLVEVLEVTLPAGAARELQEVSAELASPWTAQTTAFAGVRGGGLESSGSSYNDYGVTFGVRSEFVNQRALRFQRYGAEGRIPREATVTAFVVEWGTAWFAQRVTIDDWRSGRGGANHRSAYTVAAIQPVEREHTWLLHSAYSHSDGLGDGFFGIVAALGDGVSRNDVETSVAVGSEYAGDRRFSALVTLTHPDLVVDHRFKPDGNTLDLSGELETRPPLSGESYRDDDAAITDGHRLVMSSNTCSGTGQAYPRPVLAWRIVAPERVRWRRQYMGQPFCAWTQVSDFGAFQYHPEVGVDVVLSSSLLADARIESELLS